MTLTWQGTNPTSWVNVVGESQDLQFASALQLVGLPCYPAHFQCIEWQDKRISKYSVKGSGKGLNGIGRNAPIVLSPSILSFRRDVKDFKDTIMTGRTFVQVKDITMSEN
jgi:hypothetical protein